MPQETKMSDRLLRSRVLNAVYKDKSDIIADMGAQLDCLLVEEALDVACDYCHPQCLKVLLEQPHNADIGSLIYKTMCSDNIARQTEMLDILLPILPDDECEWVAHLACESFWPTNFSQIFDRLPENIAGPLKMQWAATQGDVTTIEHLMDKNDIPQLNRTLVFATAASQWDVCRFLVPLCDYLSVLYDLHEENKMGSFSRRIECLKDIIEEHKNQCQNQTLMENISLPAPKSVSRKI